MATRAEGAKEIGTMVAVEDSDKEEDMGIREEERIEGGI